MKPSQFVHNLDHNRIVLAIRNAEAGSRGEVRVHVAQAKVEDAQAEAAVQFAKLGMAGTAERNGVLVFVAPKSQRFAVIGDAAIHARCGESFWREVAASMEGAFREGRFTDGIVHAVEQVGRALALHFPRTAAADVNELPDEVSES